MIIGTLGIDIAKNTFQLHGADRTGNTVLKKRLYHEFLQTHCRDTPLQLPRYRAMVARQSGRRPCDLSPPPLSLSAVKCFSVGMVSLRFRKNWNANDTK